MLCAASLLSQAGVGDYPEDAGPPMHALVTGHIGRFFAEQPLMGGFAILARAPFALVASLAGGGEAVVYDAGVLACVLALSAFAIYLVRRGEGSPNRLLLVAVLAVMTPAVRDAVVVGHPEELLGAVLSVTAVLLAGRRSLWAGIALGLALATKQWAILAVVPVLMAAPRGRRFAAALAAAGTAIVLTLPLAVGSFGAYARISGQAATSPTTTGRATVWFLFAHPHHTPLHLGPGFPTVFTTYHIAGWLAQLTHPMLVVLLTLLALAAWRRGGDPLAVLALVFLERCVLDPVDNEYYHVPFLLALLAYEVVSRRRAIPVMTIAASAGLWVTFDLLDYRGAAPALTNAVYLLWTTPIAVYLLAQANLLPSRLRMVYVRPVTQPSANAGAAASRALEALASTPPRTRRSRLELE